MRESKRALATVALLFFVSGMCGLVYEVLWMRMLGLLIGSTAYAMATVLTAFMVGLALGSYLAGRVADRMARPVLAYGLVEILIGVYCAALPFLILSTEPLFRVVYRDFFGSFYVFALLRFCVCGALLLAPATLMGATLPLLVRYVAHESGAIGMTVGGLYAVNTFGAVVGALAAGFVLVPSFGAAHTTWLAAALNLVVGAVAIGIQARFGPCERAAAEEPIEACDLGSSGRLYVFALAVSGFCGMALQIAWTRVLALSLGGSTYTFSIIVACFIMGIALGAAAFGRLADRLKDGVRGLGLVQAAIGLSALLVAPALGKLPVAMAVLVGEFSSSFALMLAVSLVLALLALIVPTFLMGGMLPLAAKLTIPHVRCSGRALGNLYAWNTVGAILGSFVAAFVLVKFLGVQRTLYAAATLDLAVGCVVLASSRQIALGTRLLLPLCGIGLAGVLMMRLPRWDSMLLASGPFAYGRNAGKIAKGLGVDMERAIRGGIEVLSYTDGPSASVSVLRLVHGQKFMRVNGKTDASTGADMVTELLLGHLPVMMHPAPKAVLVVGIGSGITSGAVLRHAIECVDSVELCPAVVAAAKRFFVKENYDCFNDARHHVIVADGRTHVALTDRRYDVISSEPPNPWVAGVANLFTVEYFRACRARLNDGGIMCSWIHAYSMAPSDLKMVVKTFMQVFPECCMWYGSEGDYLMIGTKGHLRLDMSRVAGEFNRRAVKASLGRVDIGSLEDLLAHLLFGPAQMEAYSRGASTNTDDNARLEYSAPKSLLRRNARLPLDAAVDASRKGWPISVSGEPGQSAYALRVRSRVLITRHLLRLGRTAEAIAAAQQLLAEHPGDAVASACLAKLARTKGERLLKAGRIGDAITALREAVERKPDSAIALRRLAFAYEQAGDMKLASATLRVALVIAPHDGLARLSLARVLLSSNQANAARKEARRVVEEYPSHADGHFVYGLALARLGREAEAVNEWERTLELWPDHSQASAKLDALR